MTGEDLFYKLFSGLLHIVSDAPPVLHPGECRDPFGSRSMLLISDSEKQPHAVFGRVGRDTEKAADRYQAVQMDPGFRRDEAPPGRHGID